LPADAQSDRGTGRPPRPRCLHAVRRSQRGRAGAARLRTGAGEKACVTRRGKVMSVAEITDDTFESAVLASELPVFVDLGAPWCQPCLCLSPIVESLSEDYAGRVKFVKVNVDENPAIREAFQISSIPLVAIVKGHAVVDSLLGLRPKGALASWIEA